ncbi:MAG: DUF308 domain-containing protein [Bifidobacteriaceae bacterium]|jgi:uncharacterized membrane protein HdeD (DUF308 family)|nr:DUF308 domain-containing protein [Bifidobacteriaceae bacterium]
MTQTQPLSRHAIRAAQEERIENEGDLGYAPEDQSGEYGPAGQYGPATPVGQSGRPGWGSVWLLGGPLEFGPRSVGRLRAWLIIRGLLGLALGAMILLRPDLSLEAFAMLIGIFFCVIGVARIIVGAADSEFTAGVRVLNVIVGVLVTAIGAVSIRYPGFGLLATVLLIGFAWMMEGAATLALLPARHQGRGWAIAFAVISLIGGFFIIMWPVGSIVPLLIVAGAVLLVGGIFDIVGAFTLKSKEGAQAMG